MLSVLASTIEVVPLPPIVVTISCNYNFVALKHFAKGCLLPGSCYKGKNSKLYEHGLLKVPLTMLVVNVSLSTTICYFNGLVSLV